MPLHPRSRDEAAGDPAARTDDAPRQADGVILGLQRSMGNRAVVHMLEAKGLISQPGDAFEQHADRAATTGALPGGAAAAPAPPRASAADTTALDAELGELGGGRPLPDEVRTAMEPRFGTDLSDVRVHTGEGAGSVSSALGADAFTYGKDVYYGAGRAPGRRPAHGARARARRAAARGGRPGEAHPAELHGQLSGRRRHLRDRLADPAGQERHADHADRLRRLHALLPQRGHAELEQHRHHPDRQAHRSGRQGRQLGHDRARRRARAARSDRAGVRTQDDAARGVEGGYFTDAHAPVAARPRRHAARPLARLRLQRRRRAGTTGVAGKTQQPADPRRRHRRDPVSWIPASSARTTPPTCSSSLRCTTRPAHRPGRQSQVRLRDRRAAASTSQYTYAAVKWGFEIVDGVVKNEYLNIQDTASATFAEAMDRHQDFYVHEPMTFYFDFDKTEVTDIEAAKIDGLLPYLTRNPKARMSLIGTRPT